MDVKVLAMFGVLKPLIQNPGSKKILESIDESFTKQKFTDMVC
jgi:hypothetical protein